MLRAPPSLRTVVRVLPIATLVGLVALLATAATASAATVVPPGEYNEDVTWTLAGSPYVLPGGVFFHRNATTPHPTLTIEPGVVVRVEQGAIKVQGGARIHAVGTAERPILFTSARATAARGDWEGIQTDSSSGATRIENATIEYAGAGPSSAVNDGSAKDFVLKSCVVRESAGDGVHLGTQQDARVIVEGCEIHHNARHGIYVPTGHTYALRANRIYDNGGTGIVALGEGGPVERNVLARNALPLRMAQGVAPLDNAFDGNARHEIEVARESTGVFRETRWQRNLDASGALVVYRVLVQSVSVDASLLIEPGVKVAFAPGTNFLVTGGLDARGTAELPILFTSDAAAKAPGQWGGVQFWATSEGRTRFEHFVIEYGTQSLTNQAPLAIADCTIRHGADDAVQAGARLEVRRCAIHDHAGDGIFAGTGGTGSFLLADSVVRDNAGVGVIAHDGRGVLERNAIERNALPVRMHPDTALAASNSFLGNARAEIEVVAGGSGAAGLTGARTWARFTDAATGALLRYLVVGNANVHAHAPLTIEPGNVVAFDALAGISVRPGGALVAVGTAEAPIVFTSARAVPARGDWRGIHVDTGTSEERATLAHVVVEYAGPAPGNVGPAAGGAIHSFRSGARLADCVLRFNTQALEVLDGADARVRVDGCAIRENEVGVSAWSSADLVLRSNRIERNALGVSIVVGGPPLFHADNNVFDNDVNALDRHGVSWFVPKTPARDGNILGNPFFGGNAWSDYKGMDCDGDGLGDTLLPYRTAGHGVDWHPLVPVNLDVTPPTSRHSLAGTPGNPPWWRSAVTVTLEATDDSCGVSAIRVRVDGGAPFVYAGPFPVAGDGVHTLEYGAEDNAGNVEAPHAVEIRIDATPPAVRITDPIRGNVYVNNVGIPLVVRQACPSTPAAAACAMAPFDTLGKECHEVLPRDVCAELPFDGVFPITVLVGTKTLGADAADATSGVVRVTFRTESRIIGADADAPYATDWDTTREPLARQTLVAVAEDEAGNVAESAPERPITVPLDPAVLADSVARLADDAVADAPVGRRLQKSK